MQLHVESAGLGKDVVLLHGWGMHGGCWDAVSVALSRKYRLHRVDLPGHGSSRYEVGDWVDALAETFPFEVCVCGWSLGGQLALEWASRYPERVARLALLSSTPCFVARAGWAHGISRELFMTFQEGLETDMAETLRRFLFLQAQGGEDEKRLFRQLQKNMKETEKEGLRRGLDLLYDNDLRLKAKSVIQPALVLQGEGDRLTPLDAGKWLAENMRDAEMAAIRGCSHAPLLSHPDFCVSKLSEFLDG